MEGMDSYNGHPPTKFAFRPLPNASGNLEFTFSARRGSSVYLLFMVHGSMYGVARVILDMRAPVYIPGSRGPSFRYHLLEATKIGELVLDIQHNVTVSVDAGKLFAVCGLVVLFPSTTKA